VAAAASSRQSPPVTVSPRWILAALGISLGTAVVCLWVALCFTFWLGNWQLLYHPKSSIAQTPAHVALTFDSIDFAAAESGQPQLHGWWIPSEGGSPFTAIVLHGADENIGDITADLLPLHTAKLSLLAFDYRGYGRSRFERPSEQHWREDAESAIVYLRDTRHIPAGSIILLGRGLGADLALEVAAAHPELAGVVAEMPLEAPEDAVFHDPRARLVPAHLLVRDRWNLLAAATSLHVPTLWFETDTRPPASEPEAYEKVGSRKVRVWLKAPIEKSSDYGSELSRWLDELAPDKKVR
jgi:hypothetical protein